MSILKLSRQELEILQEWQDSFSSGHGIAIRFLDTEGVAVTGFGHDGCLCDKLNVPESERKECPWQTPLEFLTESPDLLVRCALGIRCFVLPLALAGRTAGYLVGGRAVCAEFEREQVRAAMQAELDMDAQQISEALEQLHVVSEDSLVAICQAGQQSAAHMVHSMLREAEFRSERRDRAALEAQAKGFANLLRTSLSLTSAAGLQQVLERIVSEAVQMAGADVATLYQYDELTGAFSHPVGVGVRDPEFLKTFPKPSKDGVAAKLVYSREPLKVTDREKYRGMFHEFAEREGLYSAIGLSLWVESRPVGVILLSSRQQSWAEGANLQLMQAFAELAGLAIDRAEWMELLSLLHTVGQAINAALDPAGLVRQVYEQTKRVLASDIFLIALRNRGKDSVHLFTVDEGVVLEEQDYAPGNIMRWVLAKGQEVYVQDARHGTPPASPSTVDTGGRPDLPQCYLFLPLVVGKEVVGIISIQSYRPGVLVERHKQILSIIASHTAIAVANSRAMDELSQARLAEQEIIKSITQDPAHMGSKIAESACNVSGADWAIIYPFDAVKSEFYAIDKVSAYGMKRDFRTDLADRPRRKGGIAARVIEQGMLVVRNPQEFRALRQEVGRKKKKSLPEKEGTQAFVGVSLKVGPEVAGVLYVNYRRPHAFTEEELRKIRVFGNEAAIAIQIARQLGSITDELRRKSDELEPRVQFLEATEEIDRAIIDIASSEERKTALGLIVEAAVRITEAPLGSLSWVNWKENTLEILAHHGLVERPDLVLPLDRGITGWAVRNRRSALVGNVKKKPWAKHYAVSTADTVSELAVPLRQGGRVVGVLNVESPAEDCFDKLDKDLLEHLARQAVIALQTVQRNVDVRKARRRLEIVTEIDRLVSSSLELDKVLHLLTEKLGEVIRAPDRGVLLYDMASDSLLIHPTAHYQIDADKKDQMRIPVGDGRASVVAWVAKNREPLSIPDTEAWAGEPAYLQLVSSTRSELAAPVMLDGEAPRLVAVFNLESPVRDAFSEDDRLLLDAIAVHAAQAIQNAALTARFKEEQEQRLRLEALNSVSDLARQFAHRMANMGGTIPTRVQQIKRLLQPSDPGYEQASIYLDSIDTDARSLMEAAKRIRRMGEIGRVEDVDLGHVAAAGAEQVRARVPDSVRVELALDKGLPLVRASRDQLVETVINILGNALDAMLDGGVLTIRVSEVLFRGARAIELQIGDTGRGIKPESLERVGTLGFSTKQGGWGFGLWHDKNLIKSLGGELVLQSEYGKGTIVSIRLPAVAG